MYSFNTLIILPEYCILFLYQYNKDNKSKEEPDGEDILKTDVKGE